MRNIAISGTWSSAIPDGNITAGIVDVDRGCLWITSEQLNADADTEIDIYKKELPGDSYEVKDVSPPLKDLSPRTRPAERYKFTATTDSTHGIRRQARIIYKPARSGFPFTSGFS